MKKAIIVILFITLLLTSGAASGCPQFNDLLDAIEKVESGGDSSAVGDNGKAVGAYQIHKIYVDDVNRISGKSFRYIDRKDKAKSRKMATIYLRHYGKGKTLIELARIHNGGPKGYKKKCTEKYAEKIKKVLYGGESF